MNSKNSKTTDPHRFICLFLIYLFLTNNIQ